MNRKQRSKLFVYYSVAIFSVFGIALSSLGMFMTAQTALKQNSNADSGVLGVNNLTPFGAETNNDIEYISDLEASKICQIENFISQRGLFKDKEVLIYEFEKSQSLFSSDQNRSRSKPIDVEVPAGSYTVVFQTHDPHSTKNDRQPKEIVKAVFSNSDGEEIVSSSATLDLPNDKDGLIQIIDNELVIDQNISKLTGVHAAFPDYSDVNSIYPICVALVPVDAGNADPTPNPLPPVAVDDNKSTTKNKPTEVDILTNDSDQDGDIKDVTTTITENPKNGTTKIVNRKVVYTPNPEFVGEDTFNYKICDVDGLCDEAVVTITVIEETPQLLPPIAVDDITTTDQNTSVTINVTINDSDPDGDITKTVITINDNPDNGTVTVNDDQRITYTPSPEFIGEDEFEYKLCDSDGLCDEAKVTISVKPTPIVAGDEDTVQAVDDTAQGPVNQPIVIEVLDNDTIDVLKDITIVANPDNGTLFISPEKKIVYQPRPDFIGDDEFSYRICSSDNLCDNATVNLEVKPAGLVLGDSSLVRSGGWSIGGFVVFLSAAILSTRLAIKSKRHKLRASQSPYNY